MTSDNAIGADGWSAVTLALSGCNDLFRLDGLKLAHVSVDLSCKEEGMALAVVSNLLLTKFCTDIKDLNLRSVRFGLFHS